MADKAVTHRARRLRRDANFSEQYAWSALRQLRKYGFPVRRQHPIGPYTVDIAITRAMIVIELDGGIHRMKTAALRDEMRDEYLASKGWRVLHINAEDA